MIEITIDKPNKIIGANINGNACDVLDEAATATVMILDTVSKALHDDMSARDLLTKLIHDENALEDFRAQADIDCEEETADA